MRIALASCSELPVPALDDALVAAALGDLGADVVTHPWDDPTVDWAGVDRCIIRSTWDYTARPREFIAWAVGVAACTELWNPAPIVAWNAHKGYLLDLAARGVPVVPTRLLEQGTSVALGDLTATGEIVVKPAISVGAIDTHRVGPDAGPAFAQADLDRLLGAGDVLVQPFQASIATGGETAIVVLDGEVTHTWVKRPAPGDFRIHEQYGGTVTPVAPTPAQLAVADAALGAVAPITGAGPVRYARVDLVEVDGAPHLMELELIEPDLHLRTAPAALDRFARLLVRP